MEDIYMNRNTAITRLEERKAFLLQHSYNMYDVQSEIAAINVALKDMKRCKELEKINVGMNTPWR